MKKIRIIYWIFTGLFAVAMFGSAVPDILVIDMAVEGFKQMGMPVYLVPFLGVAKLLGVIAILIPGYPRIKEWAYAGLCFDLVGAAYSVMSIGMPVAAWIPMIIILAIGLLSYLYYHKKVQLRSGNAPVQNQKSNQQNEKSKITNAAIA